MEKNTDINNSEINKKKRGKKKSDVELTNDSINKNTTPNIQIFIEDDIVEEQNQAEALTEPAKKRGRKPKGGKLTLNCQKKNETINSIANIILHLKCSINDLSEYNYKLNKMVKYPLEYDPSIPPDIYTYSNMDNATPFSMYEQDRHTNENTASSIIDQCMLQTPTSYLDSINYSRLNEPSELDIQLSSLHGKGIIEPRFYSDPLEKLRLSDHCGQRSVASLPDEFGHMAFTPPTTNSVGEVKRTEPLCGSKRFDRRSPEEFGPTQLLTTNQDIPAYTDTAFFTQKNQHLSVLGGAIATEVATDIAKAECDITNIKDINAKLKRLKIHLYKNHNYEKKSACFWCTYDYDNPTCYIPKYEMDDKIYGYGSFCRPECAVAYLMKENIDDSMKFERYHLLNQIYSKIYDFKKNIKPAPNPYYLLEKYYGNLTIQEYRKLLKTEHMLLVIDKPLTRILPELHEDNEDILLNTYASGNSNHTVQNNTGVYKVKRSSDKAAGPSKSSIIKDIFM